MALKTELMSLGMPAGQANRLGQDAVATVAGAGTTQATGTALTSNFTIVSTAPASSGVVAKSTSDGPQLIYNGGANTLKVYGNGTETINGIAGSTGVSVPTLKSVLLIGAGTGSIAVISA